MDVTANHCQVILVLNYLNPDQMDIFRTGIEPLIKLTIRLDNDQRPWSSQNMEILVCIGSPLDGRAYWQSF